MSGVGLRASRWAVAAFAIAWMGMAQPGLADERVEGAGIYLMEPGMPSVFTVDRTSPHKGRLGPPCRPTACDANGAVLRARPCKIAVAAGLPPP